ncbi:MDR family MFS transporter [Apilactobacillus xinyiensis]|uniref:Multidrug efflux MFS transporter n=1 Tax=Apilactobacillus xinyiensis TaxID=2841032 RepID=A0ABT0I3C1_9LACO|nr:MDR family MFS transporter [Apilactobacillus xinyiensis]MCK8625198.1 multidrug efflux MFS transporter [Apilactobacillus xinyiensis]MCL0319335.1 multidrug efflux MFS transporter [Apilactobacillus xinyiensis]
MNTDIKGNSYNRTILMGLFLAGSFVGLLSETFLNNALVTIMDSFQIGQSMVQWLSTGFLLVVGLMIPISSWVFNNFNTRFNYIGMLFIFLVGSIVSACAINFPMLLIGRLIQAIAAGSMMPFVQNIMLVMFPPEKRGMALGLTGLVVGLGPAIGPSLAGIILQHYSWHMLFIIPAVATVIVIVLALIFARDLIHTRKTKLDWLSFMESVIGFGSVLYVLSKVGEQGKISFSSIVLVLVGILMLFLFIHRQNNIDNPLVNMNIFKNHNFNLNTILSTLSNIALVGIELILPLYLQNVTQVSALETGLVMLPGAIAMGICNVLAGGLYDKVGVRKVSLIGFFILLTGTIPMLFFNAHTNIILIAIVYAYRLTGVAFIMMNTFTDGINSLPNELSADGNAVSSTVRQVGGSVGTALSMLIVTLIVGNNTLEHTSISTLSNGYHSAFIFMLLIAIAGFGLSLKLKRNK